MNKNDDIFNNLKSLNPPNPDSIKKKETINLARQSFKHETLQKNILHKNVLKSLFTKTFIRFKQSLNNFFHNRWKMATAFASICVIAFVGYFSHNFLQHQYITPKTHAPIAAVVPAQILKNNNGTTTAQSSDLNQQLELQKTSRLSLEAINEITEPALNNNQNSVEMEAPNNTPTQMSNVERKPLIDEKAKSPLKYKKQNVATIKGVNNDHFIILNALLAITQTTLWQLMHYNK